MIHVEIRPYRDKDFPAVHLLEMAGGHEYYRSAVFVRQMGEICPSTFLVAIHNHEPVGYTVGAQVQDTPHSAWILRIGVREDLRRNGVGSALLAGLCADLYDRGVRVVRLTVSPENRPACALYARMGFTPERSCPEYFGRGGDRIVMRKDLA